jgi:hypothetical protein
MAFYRGKNFLGGKPYTVGRQGGLAVWSVLDKKLVLFHDGQPFRITRILWLSTEVKIDGFPQR